MADSIANTDGKVKDSSVAAQDFTPKKDLDVAVDSDSHSESDGFRDSEEPTAEDFATLRRVSTKIPWLAMTIAFVEFCERFGWYGSTQVFTNFIQQPLPPMSTTGSITQTQACYDMYGADACTSVAGALGQGQRASTGLTTFNQFWAYIMPLVGAWVADEFLGRFKTIQWSILFAVIGHLLLIISSLPPVIKHSNSALGVFALALIILGIGTGGFKSNISALIAEQVPDKHPKIVITKKGERVIADPTVTISRIYLYFYMMVNVGSLAGGIGMVYAERYVGFWLAFLLPTALFLLAPIVLLILKNKYSHTPPAYSVFGRSIKLLGLAMKPCWTLNPIKTYKNFRAADFWENVKPSKVQNPPAWYADIDDAWVDQVRRGFAACKVFCWLPLYWLCYNQINNNLISQAATLELHGVPNDIISNLDPFALVILIPIFDKVFYPTLRKLRINFSPLKRMTMGFFVASSSMVAAAVIQYYIYHLGPCGWHMNSCDKRPAPINVWVQTAPFVLVAISEIFASITSLEYAFTKAPENMRSIVQGVALAQTAFAAAIGQAFTPLSEDPLLIWNYTVIACLAFAGGVLFWWTWHDLDKEEDQLNQLQGTGFLGRKSVANTRNNSVVSERQADPEKAAARLMMDGSVPSDVTPNGVK